MKKWLRRLPDIRLKENRYLWYILILPGYLISFFLVEKFGPDSYWVSYLPLDDLIPLCEPFVLIYILWYPFMIGTGLFLLLKDHEEFILYMSFVGLTFGITLLFCLLFPNGQELRPTEFERSNIFTWILGFLYTVDDNQNVLPSMHVLGSIAAAVALCHSRSVRPLWIKIGAVVLAVLISASTVLVKQHSILDGFAALPLAAVLFLALYKPWRKRNK